MDKSKSIFWVLSALIYQPHSFAQDDQSINVLSKETIEEIVVTGQKSYMRLTETATKMELDLLDTPLSVTMLNRAFLEDISSESLADAYPYTLGLSQSGANANSFTLRGLSSDLQNIQVDGLPGLASRFGSPTTANIERVEVLKGPASVLYGLMEPGGLINIVTKQPSAEDVTTVGLTAQSYSGEGSSFGKDSGFTATLDSTGALTENDRWLYRAILSVEQLDSFRGGVSYDNVYFFPSLSYQFSPNTIATFGLEYLKEEGVADQGLVAVNNDIDLIAPITTRYQEDNDFDNDDGTVLFARLEHELTEDLNFKLNYRSVFHKDERHLFENNRVNDADDINEATLRRRDRHQINEREYHFIDANVAYRFETGSVTHNILAGVNGGLEISDFERVLFGSNVTPNISIFDPEFNVGVPEELTSGTDRLTERWNYGAYAQDVINLNDQFSVMLGVRYDKQDVDFTEQTTGFEDSQVTTEFLPQGGIVFRANESVSLYASYTESFNPNSVEDRDVNGNSFDPEIGSQIEMGIKASLLNERVNLTLAAFDIEKSNIIETNENGDDELLGALESNGVEFELQALLTDNWQVRFGYAYVDSIISDSPDTELIGLTNAFAPENDLFAWTRYNFPEQIMGGIVGVSLGINHESERFTDADPSTQVEFPAFTRVDFGAYFDTENYRLAFNIENAFDELYFTGGTRDTRIYPGGPRQVTLSLQMNF